MRFGSNTDYLLGAAVGLAVALGSAAPAAELVEDAGAGSQTWPWGLPLSLRHIGLGLSGPCHLARPFASRHTAAPS